MVAVRKLQVVVERFLQIQCLFFLRTYAVSVNGILAVRALADTGCSRSFIKKEVAEKAQAKKVGQKTLTIESFGGNRMQSTFDIVRVKIQGVNTKAVIGVESYGAEDPIGVFPKLPDSMVVQVQDRGFTPLADNPGGSADTLG